MHGFLLLNPNNNHSDLRGDYRYLSICQLPRILCKPYSDSFNWNTLPVAFIFVVCSLFSPLIDCFIIFLQKWNSLSVIPVLNSSSYTKECGKKEMSLSDCLNRSGSFPLEQLQSFPQLLQNIHCLEVCDWTMCFFAFSIWISWPLFVCLFVCFVFLR